MFFTKACSNDARLPCLRKSSPNRQRMTDCPAEGDDAFGPVSAMVPPAFCDAPDGRSGDSDWRMGSFIGGERCDVWWVVGAGQVRQARVVLMANVVCRAQRPFFVVAGAPQETRAHLSARAPKWRAHGRQPSPDPAWSLAKTKTARWRHWGLPRGRGKKPPAAEPDLSMPPRRTPPPRGFLENA